MHSTILTTTLLALAITAFAAPADSISIRWTEPDENGGATARLCEVVELRWSLAVPADTAAWWAAAFPAGGRLTRAAVGGMSVLRCPARNGLHFLARFADEEGNWSWSNVAAVYHPPLSCSSMRWAGH